jgi:hypothetical protein
MKHQTMDQEEIERLREIIRNAVNALRTVDATDVARDLESQAANRVVHLGLYKMTVTLPPDGELGNGRLTSDLYDLDVAPDHPYNITVNMLESLVLAHACAGIDVTSPAYLDGVETAFDAVLCRLD